MLNGSCYSYVVRLGIGGEGIIIRGECMATEENERGT